MGHDIAQKEIRGSCFYLNPSTSHLTMLRDLALDSDNMTWVNFDLGERVTFLLNQVKCANIVSMIVELVLQTN